jgi:hypothetical protein
MPVEPRFRDQIRCLVLKDRRARALNDALSPDDRVRFNDYLVSVIAVVLARRPGRGDDIEELAALSDEIAVRHRGEGRPVNEFVVEEILREIHGLPPLFHRLPVPPATVSGAGAALLRHLTAADPGIAAEADRLLDAADHLHERRIRS